MQHHDQNLECFKELEIIKSKIAALQEAPGEFTNQLRAWEARCEEIRNQLILANLGLVRSLARKYMHNGLDFHDLVQEGVIGLGKAIPKFDWQRGCKLSTYAQPWIVQAMKRALSKQARTIRLPEHRFAEIIKVKAIAERLTMEFESEPSPEEIAWEMDIPVHQVRALLAMERQTTSLDAPRGERGDATIIDFVDDPTVADPGRALDLTLQHKWLSESLEALSKREREVFQCRHGLGDLEPQGLEEIGLRLGVCKERVRQIEKRAYEKVVAFIRSRNGNGFLKAVKQSVALRKLADQGKRQISKAGTAGTRRGVITRKKKDENPNHHIWNNNGTWFCKFRVHCAGGVVSKFNQSLKTRSVEEARIRRDQLFSDFAGSGHDAAA